MNLLKKLFSTKTPQPEDKYIVTVTEEIISVYHHEWSPGEVEWNNIHTILLINTDEGPWLSDLWLTLISDVNRCTIPQGAKVLKKFMTGFQSTTDLILKTV